jgi:hypothetical protein
MSTPETPIHALHHSKTRMAKLAEPFPSVMVKKNPHGLDYVPVAEVVARMNAVVGAGRWRVEILKTETWGEQETAFGLCPVHVIATVRVHVFDGAEWTWCDGMGGQDVGFYKDKSKGPLNLGDSFKGACSDATKKALQHMGVALDLARNDEAIRWEQQEETVDLKPYINAELNEAEQEALKAVWKDTYKFRADAVPQSKEQEALTLIDLFAGTQVEDEAPVPFDNDELSV